MCGFAGTSDGDVWQVCAERFPETIEPMLAVLGTMPAGSGYGFEFKWDGVRAVVTVAAGAVRAVSRNNLDITASYPELLALPHQLGAGTHIFDGELVTLDATGRTSFSLLQQRMHTRRPTPRLLSRIPVRFYAFDLLRQDATVLLRHPYTSRRQRLDTLSIGEGTMVVPPCFPAPGAPVAQAALAHGIEGVIAKKLASPYEPGRRSNAWIKIPHNRTQEVIIVGWKPSSTKGDGVIGSLMLGAHNAAGELDYIGGVGTGFTAAALADLARRMRPLARPTPALTGRKAPAADARGAHWTEPVLVGEVRYRNITPAGTMRHPSWRGLRPDKNPAQVTIGSAP